MPRNQLKSIVAWIIILGHLGLIVTLLTNEILSVDQKIKVLLALAPIATAYFVAVVKNIIGAQKVFAPGPMVNVNFVAISILLPSIFILFIFYLIKGYPTQLADDSDLLQRWIAGLEVGLGGTVGLVVDDLFPRAS
jgi:hypothetical protein